MNYDTPKVSIIMGIYNCRNTLKEAIESILNQSYKNWELIMCDDCSSDGTYELAKEFEILYPDKIKVLKNKVNKSLGPSLNKCIHIAKGKYIARHDGDDLSHTDRLSKQVEFLENNKEYDLVGSSMLAFNENGIKGKHKQKEIPNKFDLIRGTTFSHPTILIKTKVLKTLGCYSEEEYTKQLEDYELWSRFFENEYKGYNLDEALYFYREDKYAYKRRINKKRRIRGIKLGFITRKKLNLPLYSYLYIIKDIMVLFIPEIIFEKYYENKLI